MTAREFARRFPNASQATIAANCEVRDSKSERNSKATLDKMAERETSFMARPLVRFTCVRKRLYDRDSVSGSCKDLLDGLRHSHLIQDDSEKHIEFQATQRQTLPNEEPHTLIEIYYA